MSIPGTSVAILARLEAALEPQVREDEDHVALLLAAQDGNPALRRLDCVRKLQAGKMRRRLPARHGLRRQAENADADTVDGFDHVRSKGRLAVLARDVGRKPGKLRLRLRLRKARQAEIELVVADGHRVVAHQVHGAHRRVALVRDRPGKDEGLRRGALDRVPRVEQQQRLPLGPGRPHGRRDARQPLAKVAVGRLIVRIHVPVQVRCVEDCQRRRGGGQGRGKREPGKRRA
jgi:hypothetical protein